jgi:hypothetical protein
LGLEPLSEQNVPGGLLVFVIFLPVYALGLWLASQILGWDLRWTQCSGLIAIIMVGRVIDRALFGIKG